MAWRETLHLLTVRDGRHRAGLSLADPHREFGEPLDGGGDGAADDRGGERRSGARAWR